MWGNYGLWSVSVKSTAQGSHTLEACNVRCKTVIVWSWAVTSFKLLGRLSEISGGWTRAHEVDVDILLLYPRLQLVGLSGGCDFG